MVSIVWEYSATGTVAVAAGPMLGGNINTI